MKVADETVASWESLLADLTGTKLGGEHSGIGLGRLGTSGHGAAEVAQVKDRSGRSHGIDTGIAYWSAPVHTDARGHVELEIPLGDIETTWRLTLVGIPDHATPATTAIDIPVALPLSVQVESGARWSKEIAWTSVSSCRIAPTPSCTRRSSPVRPAPPLSSASQRKAPSTRSTLPSTFPLAPCARTVAVKALGPGRHARCNCARRYVRRFGASYLGRGTGWRTDDLTRTVWMSRESRFSSRRSRQRAAHRSTAPRARARIYAFARSGAIFSRARAAVIGIGGRRRARSIFARLPPGRPRAAASPTRWHDAPPRLLHAPQDAFRRSRRGQRPWHRLLDNSRSRCRLSSDAARKPRELLRRSSPRL